MRKYIILILIFAVLWYIGDHRGHVELGPGEMAPEIPLQKNIENPAPFVSPYYDEDVQFTPLADFQIKAKVLSAKDYLMGSESAVSPLDLALGWGPMSDETLVSQINVSQRSRWFFFEPKERKPMDFEMMLLHSSNMHMIPANSSLKKAMKDVRVGDIIELSGYLVQVDRDGGWSWKSSMSRKDKGNGACELVWVDHFVNLTEHIKS